MLGIDSSCLYGKNYSNNVYVDVSTTILSNILGDQPLDFGAVSVSVEQTY